MTIKRIAVILDDSVRADTTGVHALCALADLTRVVHYRPASAHRIPEDAFDLHLSIDDDSDLALTTGLQPLAYWAIDTHLDFAARLERSCGADLVFAAQRNGAERLRRVGADSASRGLATS